MSFRSAKALSAVFSLLFCALGVLLIIRPGISASVLCMLAGVALTVFGVVRIVSYCTSGAGRWAFQLELVVGLLSAVVGLILLIWPERVLSFVFFVVGIFVLVDGLTKIQLALDAKRLHVGSWLAIALLAAASCVLGVLLLLRPFSGANAVMVLTGCCFVAEGLTGFCAALSARLL